MHAGFFGFNALLFFALLCFSTLASAQFTECFDPDPTAANDDLVSVDANSQGNSLDVLANDSRFTGGVNCPAFGGGSTTIADVTPMVGSEGGTINTDGSALFYTPPLGKGEITETFTYTARFTIVFDGGGTESITDTAQVTVTVGPIGSVDAVDDQFDIASGSGAVDFDVLANDSGSPVVITTVTQGSNGGAVGIISGTAIRYTPPANFPNAFVDTFSYTIQGTGPLQGSQDTAVVTVRGPDAPPADSIAARDDNFQINASAGQVELSVLDNDVGDNLVISSVNGNVRGRIGRTGDGRRIVYVPPANLVGNITELFSYTIATRSRQPSGAVKLRPTSAVVKLTVLGGNALTPIGQVPTSSIGKIKSDLPIARAVENLCDLLTFRNDPRTFANDPRPPGGLSAAQQDLRQCACAIVNESDVGRQRNAIKQLSGGQHQFSDTVLRFAKANAGVIQRRLSELRTLATGGTASPLSSLASKNRELLVENDLSRQRGSTDISRFNDSRSNPSYDEYDQKAVAEIDNPSVFDTLSVNTNSTYMSFPLGGGAGDTDNGLFGNRWGIFVSASSGNGDGDDAEFEFDFDSYDVTVGIDNTRPGAERTWVFGGALSAGSVETEADGGAGETKSDSVGVTLYGALFGTNGWYLDAALDISRSDIDIDRVVNFTASGKSVFQTSSGDTEGDELGLSIGGGKEFNVGANTVSADIRLQYIDGSVDGLTENIVGQDNGFGLALQTDDFDIESFRSEIGIQFTRAISTKFGVVLPFAGATWIHEFEDRGSDIPARFVVDPFSNEFNQLEEDAPGGSNRPTLFVIPGDENDSNYARLSLGSSFNFAGGKSAWFSIDTVAGLDDINSTRYTAGFRWEIGK